MRTQRPKLTDRKIDAFLEGASGESKALPENSEKNAKKAAPGILSAKLNKKASGKAAACTMAKQQKPIGKFLVEMPSELRKKIKFRSVADGVSMNELIVNVLRQHFK